MALPEGKTYNRRAQRSLGSQCLIGTFTMPAPRQAHRRHEAIAFVQTKDPDFIHVRREDVK
jgi:hypothetical protein